MKRFLSQYVLLQIVLCLFLMTTGLSIIFILTDNDVVSNYITAIMLNFVFVVGGTPALIIGGGTISFCEDRIIYKNSLFSRRQEIYYSDITKVLIDYQNYPKGLKSAIPKSISIMVNGKVRCQTDISLGIIKELLKHIDKSKIRVSFFENLCGFPKKHRRFLYEYLKTEKQKRTVAESFKKDIEVSFVVACSNSVIDIEKCLNSILQQNYKQSKYEILLIMDSYNEEIKERAKKCLMESGVFYRFFLIEGKNSSINTIVNNNALSEQVVHYNI